MTPQQKLVVLTSILASFVAFLDGSIINVALPAISRDLGGGLSVQQWIVDAYLLSLGALILLAGSLSDLFGRRRILTIGLVGFGVTSVLCAIAPSALFLIIARGLQGMAGALIVPSSLALIMSTFSGHAQGRAIGIWTGWTGVAFVVGPLLGGFLVDTGSWRLIFAINILPIIITLLCVKLLQAEKHITMHPAIDVTGAILGIAGLAGPVYALIQQPHYGWTNPQVIAPLIVGLLALLMFILHERRTKEPMMPLDLFQNRNFAIGNIATVMIYAGLSLATFLLTVYLQQVAGYSAIAAGAALLPITVLMFFLSGRAGTLASKFGPRLFMTAGPIIAGLGFFTMLRTQVQTQYWTQLFPGIIIFGLGLSLTVAPLTSAILGSIAKQRAGIGSAINNAVSRIAGLIAIALVGVVTGPQLDLAGFKRGLIVMALLLIIGGLVSAAGIRNHDVTP
jgi:EmrB/QacA subfamily drug resistance transporter